MKVNVDTKTPLSHHSEAVSLCPLKVNGGGECVLVKNASRDLECVLGLAESRPILGFPTDSSKRTKKTLVLCPC